MGFAPLEEAQKMAKFEITSLRISSHAMRSVNSKADENCGS
jgi:hypothetical protein